MKKPQQLLTNTSNQAQGMHYQEQGNVIVFDLRELTHFRADGPFVQILSDIGTARLVLFAFKAGQQIKEHRTSSQLLVQVLRGSITFTTPGNSEKLQAGKLLQLEENVPHSVVARTDAIMLLTMTPSPSCHSLQHEVFGALKPLVTRSYRNA